MEQYRYFPGTAPVVISIPHAGTYVPSAILERFTAPAKQLPDTDWHVEKLYAFAHKLGAHMLVATHSRYVVDLNRAPDGQSLYPGKFTTGLCPLTLFDGSPIYQENMEPSDEEIHKRIASHWQPYHQKLQDTLAALKAHSPRVVLFDAHSICSQVPTLFEGRLPDLNIGTADGASADSEMVEQLLEISRESPYSAVCNGRFKGGYITRHYGEPHGGIHAVQLELAQDNYMEEDFPFAYDESKAQGLQETLHALLSALVDWSRISG